ncbi:hypothetical protein GCM10022197_21540 [Microlunatus spumicola]|uniref:Uncharacterized protein n=1 Tax=Microlunatus spumicola TaxID=81499 RepID=A0ABP6XFQ0_9ACTN
MTEPALPVGYATSIRPLFRELDRNSMLKAFDLWRYEDVLDHRDAILARLSAGTMPCDGAWPASSVDLLRRWIAGGSLP